MIASARLSVLLFAGLLSAGLPLAAQTGDPFSAPAEGGEVLLHGDGMWRLTDARDPRCYSLTQFDENRPMSQGDVLGVIRHRLEPTAGNPPLHHQNREEMADGRVWITLPFGGEGDTLSSERSAYPALLVSLMALEG